MLQRIVTIILIGVTCVSGLTTAAEPARQAALDELRGLEKKTRQLSMDLWDYSEIALREERSAELLASYLESEGFQVERGVAGMPTAFVASWGTGRPTIGILAEYDALPGVGNAAVPERSPREDGVTSGQGCGHNLFGAASATAAVAIKRTMESAGISGTVRFFGTPAEETVVGVVEERHGTGLVGVRPVVPAEALGRRVEVVLVVDARPTHEDVPAVRGDEVEELPARRDVEALAAADLIDRGRATEDVVRRDELEAGLGLIPLLQLPDEGTDVDEGGPGGTGEQQERGSANDGASASHGLSPGWR